MQSCLRLSSELKTPTADADVSASSSIGCEMSRPVAGRPRRAKATVAAPVPQARSRTESGRNCRSDRIVALSARISRQIDADRSDRNDERSGSRQPGADRIVRTCPGYFGSRWQVSSQSASMPVADAIRLEGGDNVAACDVAGRSRSKRAAAESADGGIETRNAGRPTEADVLDCLTGGVVHMHCDAVKR